MKPENFISMREDLGLDQLAMARLIGYSGSDRNSAQRVDELERGKREIPLYIGRLVWLEWRVLTAEPRELLSVLLNRAGEIDWPKGLT